MRYWNHKVIGRRLDLFIPARPEPVEEHAHLFDKMSRRRMLVVRDAQ